MSNARRGGRIGAKPTLPGVEQWVTERGAPAAPSRADLYTARLTVDVTPELRARIKLAAFGRGLTVAEMLRTLLEERFPEASSGTGRDDAR
jgi:hypothetical protein